MRRTRSSRNCWGRAREGAEGSWKQEKAVELTAAVLVWQAAIAFSDYFPIMRTGTPRCSASLLALWMLT